MGSGRKSGPIRSIFDSIRTWVKTRRCTKSRRKKTRNTDRWTDKLRSLPKMTLSKSA